MAKNNPIGYSQERADVLSSFGIVYRIDMTDEDWVFDFSGSAETEKRARKLLKQALVL